MKFSKNQKITIIIFVITSLISIVYGLMWYLSIVRYDSGYSQGTNDADNKAEKNITKESLSDNSGNTLGVKTQLEKCNSDFKNVFSDDWNIDKHWKRHENNSQQFIFEPNRQLGGPEMKYNESVSDNFHLMLDFVPIANANNKDGEINLVIYIGNLYEIVIGDGNSKNFYLEKDGLFVPELKMYSDKKVSLPNPISFDKWVTLDINQSISSYSATRTITVNFYYTPYAFGIKDSEKKPAGPYTFEINDDSPCDKVSREIRIGLVNSEKENTIITEFKCFKLESY